MILVKRQVSCGQQQT